MSGAGHTRGMERPLGTVTTKRRPPAVGVLVILVCLAGTVAVLAIALNGTNSALLVLSRHGVPAQATLTSCEVYDVAQGGATSDGSPQTGPERRCSVRFTTANLRPVTTHLAFALPEGPDMAQPLAIRYDPHHPRVAAADNSSLSLANWLGTQIGIGIALLVMLGLSTAPIIVMAWHYLTGRSTVTGATST